jgi:RimJ/RimL family protein N-acetyltransferase
MNVPPLETSRLVLRGSRLDDFDAYAAMWADPKVTRHLGDGAPYSEEQSWASFLRQAGHWEMLGFGSWAVEEKASRRLIGGVGFSERKRERGDALKGLPELGWMFASTMSGNGYATEALRAALEWGKVRFGAQRVIAITAPENIASMRVAQKCGFREFRRGLSAGRERVFFDRIL